MKKISHEDLQVTYRINSQLGPMDNDRYNQKIIGKVRLKNENGEILETIGYISANRLLIELGFNAGYGPFDIYDVEADLLDVGGAVYEFADGEWNPAFDEYYKGGLGGQNILILSRLELLPKYRGFNFGPYLIKDIYNNFIDGMALFVVNVFPIQFEAGILESTNEFALSMEYDKMEKNIETATSKIISFYEKIGFEMIPAVSTEFMFINPSLINERFDKIILE